MTNGWWLAARCLGGFAVAALAGCGGGVPVATNPAVKACAEAADKQDLEVIEQQTVQPINQTGYRIEFMISDKKGDRRATCDWDPSTGPRIGDLR